MSKRIDLTGIAFGRLTVIDYAYTRKRGRRYEAHWNCLCECGNTVAVESLALRSGHTKSCGCLQKSVLGDSRRIHGKTNTRLFNVWCNLLARCENPNHRDYSSYGGRGVSVCREWHCFETFAECAEKNGYVEECKRGQCTIDRIDNDKGYCPENCRWVPQRIQNNNRRSNIKISIGGVAKTATEWAIENGVNPKVAHARIRSGWDKVKAVTT